jgi:hypothetical protein
VFQHKVSRRSVKIDRKAAVYRVACLCHASFDVSGGARLVRLSDVLATRTFSGDEVFHQLVRLKEETRDSDGDRKFSIYRSRESLLPGDIVVVMREPYL